MFAWAEVQKAEERRQKLWAEQASSPKLLDLSSAALRRKGPAGSQSRYPALPPFDVWVLDRCPYGMVMTGCHVNGWKGIPNSPTGLLEPNLRKLP